jgi:subtilase family serine protease
MGSMDNNVKIRLYQGDTKILNISNSTANDGSYSWDIPPTVAAGTYKVRVKTLDGLVWDDSDAFTVAQCQQNPPDLVIQDMTVNPRNQTTDGISRPLCDAWIVNIGNGRSEATTAQLKVYIHRSPILNRQQWVRPLEPGEKMRFGQLPQLPRPGKYRYVLTADLDNKINESDDGNNSKTVMYRYIACQLPDLTVQLGIKKSVKFGQIPRKWVTVYIKNKGRQKSVPCTLMVWLDGSHYKSYLIPEINPGVTLSRNLMKLPMVSVSGRTKTFRVEVDRLKVVDECDEENNRAERTYKF